MLTEKTGSITAQNNDENIDTLMPVTNTGQDQHPIKNETELLNSVDSNQDSDLLLKESSIFKKEEHSDNALGKK
ncbi:hypothetical protein CEXT_28181 [Caerostris extrusa]|uniref:Uncharacterized protein n=1 Tax=Caerostris extrusa TaxID=172846 RepID=A0AAV4XNV2_CAEEX|nr:hypothetical protein CEXT_28181 [Caerostris extrusa]